MVSLDLQDTPAQPGAIRGAAEGLRRLESAITGHGTDTTAAIHQSAAQFSDIIAPQVLALGQWNENAWRAAVLGVEWGAATTHIWANDVEAFKRDRQRLLDQFAAEQGSGFNVPRVDSGAVSAAATASGQDGAAAVRQANQQYDSAVAAAGNALVGRLQAEFRAIYDRFKAAARDRGAELSREASDADLRRLAGAGLLSWAGYLAAPPGANVPPPVTELEGRRAADILNRVARGEQVPQHELDWALNLLGAVNVGIAAAGSVGLAQAAFLKALYHGLGPNLLHLPSRLKDAGQLRIVANGLLNLSRDDDASVKAGAGIKALPQYLQDLLGNPAVTRNTEGQPGFQVLGDENAWRALSALLGSTVADGPDQKIAGGTEFSEHLTRRVSEFAYAVNAIQEDRNFYPNISGLLYDFSLDNKGLSNLLDVSTRNHLANVNLLTSDQHGALLDNLTSVDWTDDGRAVNGLFNTVAEDHRNNPLDPRVTQAAANVIEHVTKDERTFDRFLENTRTNKQLAFGFGELAGAYVGDFGEGNSDLTRVESDGSLQIQTPDRDRFLALVATNGEAYNALAVRAGQYEAHRLDLARAGIAPPGQPAPENLGLVGAANGRLEAQLAGSAELLRQDGFLDGQADSKTALAFVNAGKVAAGIAGGPTSTIASIAGEIANGVFGPPNKPGVDPNVQFNQPGGELARASYDYAGSYVRSAPDGWNPPPDVAKLFERTPDGRWALKPATDAVFSEPSSKTALENWARQNGGGIYLGDYRSEGDNHYKDTTGRTLNDK